MKYEWNIVFLKNNILHINNKWYDSNLIIIARYSEKIVFFVLNLLVKFK